MSLNSETLSAHENAAQLIPWLINGTLTGIEAARLRAHLADCPRCRADCEAEERLYQMIRRDGPLVFPGESAFQKLMSRIEADEFAASRGARVGTVAETVSDSRNDAGEEDAREETVIDTVVERLVDTAHDTGDDPVGTAAGAVTDTATRLARVAHSGSRASDGERLAESDERSPADAEQPERGKHRRARGAERSRGAHRGASRRRRSRRALWRSPVVMRWLAAAVALEALGLGLGAWMWRVGRVSDAGTLSQGSAAIQAIRAPYRTLTSPAPRYGAGAQVRVVFRGNLSLERLQSILHRIGAHIVDGPTDAHVYTLGFAAPLRSEQALDARIAMLRADPDVLFAEPAGVPP